MNDDLLLYVILTAVAAFAGGLGLGVSQWMSSGLKSSTRKVFHLVLLVFLWPFRWVSRGIKEWRRVSGYRHRDLTWDDLPQQSKSKVLFEDLSDLARELINWDDLPQGSKDKVLLQDLCEDARNSIDVKDLPRGQKITLLDKFIFPQLQAMPYEGRLSLIDDKGYVSFEETARITIAQTLDIGLVMQDGMQLALNIAFANPASDVQIPMGRDIAFTAGRWFVLGTVRGRARTGTATQTVTVRVRTMSFESLVVYKTAV